MRKQQARSKEKNSSSRKGRAPRSRGDERLALLHRSLLKLIARFGAGGVTHRNLADEAGVSLSATTYYYESKQDMIRKAFQFLSSETRTGINRLVEQHAGPTPGTAKLEDEVSAAGQFLRARLQADADENLTLIELMLTLARDEEARRLLEDDRKAVRQFVVDLMERSHSSHPDEDTDLLMALVNGLVLESLARGRPAEFEKRAIAISERVMKWMVTAD